MIKTRNTTMIIIAAGTLAAAIGGLIYMGYQVRQQGVAFERDFNEYFDQEQLREEFVALERELGETDAARTQLGALVLNGDEDAVTFLSKIDAVAAELGLTLVTEGLEIRKEKKEPYNMLDATFNIEGSNAAVLTMLQLLEVWPYHSYVGNVQLKRAGAVLPGKAEVVAKVTFSVTLRKE